MPSDITSVNIVLVIGSVEAGIPLGTVIQAFAPDTGVSGENITLAETSMGVDGTFYAGYTPQPYILTFTLGASSESNTILEALAALQQTSKRVYNLVCTYIVPATNKAYALYDGVLSSFSPFPEAGTTLQPREYTLTFGRWTPTPIPDVALSAVAQING